jgi:hypothetical protein
MTDRVQFDLVSEATDASTGELTSTCPPQYRLRGPQIEPEASCWLRPNVLRMISEAELNARVNAVIQQALTESDRQFWAWPELTAANPGHPTQATTINRELEEIIQLSRLRDEPNRLSNTPNIDNPAELPPQRVRLQPSSYLQFRPQPLGATINSARDQSTFPVVGTGRELARYFENEPPGIQFRHALTAIIRESNFSPPRQALAYAALDMAILAAQSAAWFFKWRGGNGVRYRPRPWECLNDLDVLFDRLPNSTNSADSARRAYPPGVRPDSPRPNEIVLPEANVGDILPPTPPQSFHTPGTPRHPAYPSAHSTYSAAAALTLTGFFPQYADELLKLADNTGLARLWAGIHWRSDHVFGQLVGRAVAELILQQLVDAKIFEVDPTVTGDVVYLPRGIRYLRPRLFVRPPRSRFSAADAVPPTVGEINTACSMMRVAAQKPNKPTRKRS